MDTGQYDGKLGTNIWRGKAPIRTVDGLIATDAAVTVELRRIVWCHRSVLESPFVFVPHIYNMNTQKPECGVVLRIAVSMYI